MTLNNNTNFLSTFTDFKRKHKKLFYFFTISISFIMVLSIIFSLLLQSFEKVVYNSLADLNHDFIIQTDALTEIMTSSMSDYASQLFYSPPIQTLRSKNPISYSQSKDKLRDLDNLLNSSDFLTSIIVHNGYTNTIYSAGSDRPVQKLETYDNAAIRTLIVNKQDEPTMTPIYCRSKDPAKEGYYAVLYYTKRESGSPAPSTLILTLNASWYEKNISLFSNYAAQLTVFNENGDVLMSTNNEIKKRCQPLYKLTLQHNSGYVTTSNDEICMYHKSPKTGYTYMRLVGLKEILPQLYVFRNTIFYILSSLIAVFFIIFIFLLLKTWLPLHQMKDALGTIDILLDTPLTSDEPPILPIDQQMESVIIKAERVRKERQLLDMLMKKISPSPEDLFAEDYHMYGFFLVSALHRAEIYKIVSKHHFQLIVCKTASAYACIGTFSENSLYESLLQEIHTTLSKRVFCSSLFSNFDTIPERFGNLSELQKLSISFPADQWKIAEETLLSKENKKPFSTKDFAELSLKLKNGNKEAALMKWHNMLNSMLTCRYELFQYALQTVSDIFNKILLECDMSNYITPFPTQPEQIDSIEHLNALVNESITNICDHFSQKKITKYSLQAADIKKVIEEHYYENDFNSQQIADSFHMNNAYLGRIFKNSCGYSISEYINECRLNESMRLLTSTSDSIEEIAQTAGFYNIKYFYVLFKKKTGMTPASYRTNPIK